MKLRFVVALGLLVASVAASGQAGFGGPQTTVPLTATYRIQPEDILRVQVFNMPQTAADVVVGRDGNITAPFTGIVRAAGKTTSELEEELRNKYIEKLRLRDPVVSVTIIRFRAVRATVGGAVIRGDVYELRPGDTLLSLLNRGGGADMTRADLRRATLRRAGSSELIPVDLYAMLVQGDTSQNFEIQDGDELSVPEERRNRIDIQGAVQAPGTYPYREPMTLQNAISLAREIPRRSMFSRVYIFRERAGQPGDVYRIHANYVRYVKNGDATQNVVLQPGDFIYVSETGTPDIGYIGSLANTAFVLDRLGGIFGLGLLR